MTMALLQFSRSRYGQYPIKCGARSFEQIGDALAAVFAVLDQFVGVLELLRGEFALSSEFNPRRWAALTPARVRTLISCLLTSYH